MDPFCSHFLSFFSHHLLLLYFYFFPISPHSTSKLPPSYLFSLLLLSLGAVSRRTWTWPRAQPEASVILLSRFFKIKSASTRLVEFVVVHVPRFCFCSEFWIELLILRAANQVEAADFPAGGELTKSERPKRATEELVRSLCCSQFRLTCTPSPDGYSRTPQSLWMWREALEVICKRCHNCRKLAK